MRLKRKRSVGEDRSLRFIVRSVNLDNFCWFGLDDYIVIFYYFLYILTFNIMYIINHNNLLNKVNNISNKAINKNSTPPKNKKIAIKYYSFIISSNLYNS